MKGFPCVVLIDIRGSYRSVLSFMTCVVRLSSLTGFSKSDIYIDVDTQVKKKHLISVYESGVLIDVHGPY